MISNGGGDGARGGGSSAPLGVAELAELGGDVPDGKARMSIEDGVNVPALPGCHSNHGLVTRLPPRADVLSPLLESPAQRVGRFLIEAVQRVAVDVVPHFGLVDVVGPRFLRVPEHLKIHRLGVKFSTGQLLLLQSSPLLLAGKCLEI